MIKSDKWILEIRGMRSRKSNRIVQDNQSSLARYIQCSNTACDTRKKTPLIQKTTTIFKIRDRQSKISSINVM